MMSKKFLNMLIFTIVVFSICIFTKIYKKSIKYGDIYKIDVLNAKGNKLDNNDIIGTGSYLNVYKNDILEKIYTNVVLGYIT